MNILVALPLLRLRGLLWTWIELVRGIAHAPNRCNQGPETTEQSKLAGLPRVLLRRSHSPV